VVLSQYGVAVLCCASAVCTAGHDISHGMRPIYNIMGLCPQHDLLWATLSGREHLRFYGALKGMSGESRALVTGVGISL
jgi:ABC-type multidrug transport system ATPase subunit